MKSEHKKSSNMPSNANQEEAKKKKKKKKKKSKEWNPTVAKLERKNYVIILSGSV